MAPAKQRFYYKGDRLKPLRAFCQVARLGSVSRAAEALFLSQPAVTLQLQALERDMGTPLFERIGRRFTLTRGGTALYELARPLVEGLDGIEAEFRNRLKGLEGGDLHVAAGSSTILYLLPPIVKAFRESPSGGATGAAQRHRQGRPEPAALGRGGPGRRLDARRADRPVLRAGVSLRPDADHAQGPSAGRHASKLQLEDLSPYGLILPPKRLTTWRLVDLVFQQRRVPYTVALEVGGWEVIKQYVAMGLGISIVTGICLTEADRERLEVAQPQRILPAAQLRRGGAQGQVPVTAGAGLRRPGQARAVRTPRLFRIRPFRTLIVRSGLRAGGRRRSFLVAARYRLGKNERRRPPPIHAAILGVDQERSARWMWRSCAAADANALACRFVTIARMSGGRGRG